MGKGQSLTAGVISQAFLNQKPISDKIPKNGHTVEKLVRNGDGGKCLTIDCSKKKPTQVQVLEFANFYHVNTPAVLTISLLISNDQCDIIEQSWEEM